MLVALNSGSAGVVMILWMALVYIDKCKQKSFFFFSSMFMFGQLQIGFSIIS